MSRSSARDFTRDSSDACGDLADRIAHVAGIQTEILVVFPSVPQGVGRPPEPESDPAAWSRGDGAADGDRQRDSTAVDSKLRLRPFFSPSVGFRPTHSVASGALPMAHRLTATARRCRASAYSASQPATASGRSQPIPVLKVLMHRASRTELARKCFPL